MSPKKKDKIEEKFDDPDKPKRRRHKKEK